MTVTNASLTVPLDVAQADGSLGPDAAKVVVCLVGGPVAASEGTVDSPPTTNCSATAPALYVASPEPHLKADLSPLASGLATATGLALLPDASKVSQTDAWRLVFSAHNRTDAGATKPATLSLTVKDASVDQPPPAVDEPGLQLPPVAVPVTGTGFAAPPVTQTPPRVQAPAQVAVAPRASAPRIVTVGYAYPAVWLLPLAFLILVPAVARTLTKDLAPVT